MIKNKRKFRHIELAVVIAIVCFTYAWPRWSNGQTVISSPLAMVDAVQGNSEITSEQNQEPTKLTIGRTIDPGNTISTSEQSKVFIQWETGMRTSLGEVSSISFEQRENQNGLLNFIEVNQGVLRVTKQSGGGNVTPYKVITPVASIEPFNYDKPVDFVIEVYTPTRMAVSVISGTVVVQNLTMSNPTETVVSSCHVAYIDKGKPNSEVLATKSDEIMPLIDGTTIPGTVATSFICPVPMWLSSARGTAENHFNASNPYLAIRQRDHPDA
ncbi:MAG: hypothetical protein ACLQPD_24730 [Desulfomonilaceae bacterium]